MLWSATFQWSGTEYHGCAEEGSDLTFLHGGSLCRSLLLLDQHVRKYAMAYWEFTHLIFAVISSTGALSTHRVFRTGCWIGAAPSSYVSLSRPQPHRLPFVTRSNWSYRLLILTPTTFLHWTNFQSTQISPVATTSFPTAGTFAFGPFPYTVTFRPMSQCQVPSDPPDQRCLGVPYLTPRRVFISNNTGVQCLFEGICCNCF